MKKNLERTVCYDSVLQDLYAKKAQLNQAIEALEVLKEQAHPKHWPTSNAFGKTVRVAARSDAEEAGGTLIAAIKAVLRQSNRPLTNREIFRAVKAAGVKFRSKNPQLSVSQVLSRSSKNSDGPVHTGRGKWTLTSHKR